MQMVNGNELSKYKILILKKTLEYFLTSRNNSN